MVLTVLVHTKNIINGIHYISTIILGSWVFNMLLSLNWKGIEVLKITRSNMTNDHVAT